MKACILTLGCKVNTYESEVIKDLFIKNEGIIVDIKNNPNVIVINTCTVTNQADAKSRKIIRSAKKNCPDAVIVVCGCSSQQHQSLLDDLGIDILLGNKDKTKIYDYVTEFIENKKKIKKFYDLSSAEFENMQIDSFEGRTRAFVKIQDGCNNFCSYCIIPYIRGKIRNKDIEAAYEEIKSLTNKGYKEIILTGIHTGSYGVGTNYNLITLIQKISKLENLKRIRISSIEITEIDDEFLEELKNNPKICNHLHIPLQNGSDSVLKMMNRKYNVEEYQKTINKIRSIRPNINVTTDIIVGFPTETDDDFKKTLENVKQIGFGKIHVFPFSKRNGTLAAGLKNIVTEKIKKERVNILLCESDILENAYYKKFINQNINVLIEETEKGISIGHTSNYIKVQINETIKHNEEVEIIIKSVDNLIVKASLNNYLKEKI